MKDAGRSTLERCVAANCTARAPGMPLASTSPCPAQGVERSWSPPITSVGACMRSSSGRWSISRMAAQHPAYPTGLVASSTARTDSATGFPEASVRAEKKRCITASSMARIPCSSTVTRRASNRLGSAMRGDVFARTRRSMRSPALAPSHCPIIPPSDSPQYAKRSRPAGVHGGQHIARQLRDGVVARRRIRRAMAAQVQPEHLKAAEQRRHLRVPHPMVGAQRMHQHQQRPGGRAFEPVVDPASFRVGERHDYSFPSSRRKRNASALPR